MEITGYSLVRGLRVGNCVESTTFSVGGYDWRIEFYPDGKTEEEDDDYSCCSCSSCSRRYNRDRYSDCDDEDADDCNDQDDQGYVSVFVVLMSKGVSVKALCDLSLVSPGKTAGQSPWMRSRKKKLKDFNGEGSCWGFEKLKKRSDLEGSEYLTDDCLKILCVTPPCHQ